ncbi:MAG: hypothetical protein JSW07_03940 [bacterium]|nr:MAG: hypothetical protein JSW07_03940 [bacterium]
MAPRTIFMTFVFTFSFVVLIHAQSEIIEAIDAAKQLYLQTNLSASVDHLSRAVELINEELLTQLESIFPEPLKNWRVDSPSSRVTKAAYTTSLISKCKYYKKGGGQSVDIEIQTNAPRIANIKMIFVNPLMLNQMGGGAKISTINDRSCIERYDPIDKFAELIFVPTSSVLITIRGYEMKNTAVIAEFTEKVKWDLLGEIFP